MAQRLPFETKPSADLPLGINVPFPNHGYLCTPVTPPAALRHTLPNYDAHSHTPRHISSTQFAQLACSYFVALNKAEKQLVGIK